MPNIEKLNHLNTESKFNRKPRVLDREQLEYFESQSNKTLLKYFACGTIGFAAIGIYAYFAFLVVQQAKK